MLVTLTSTLSPTLNLSGLCSARSRERSDLRMKDFIPSYSTSIPPSSIDLISTVITEPRLTLPVASANLSPPKALIDRLIRSFSTSTSETIAFTMSPFLKFCMASSPRSSQEISLKWTMPSMSPCRPTNKPNSVIFLTSPSTSAPSGFASAKTSHGLRMVCFNPSETRRFASSISSTITSTS